MSNNKNPKKTQRKNKTNQIINWPNSDDYFTIDSLIKTNEHMLTNSGSDITLRVRLMRSVKGDGVPQTVAVIGTTNLGKGRPQLVFSMLPVKASVIEKAKNNKIMLIEESKLVPVMEISNVSNNTPAKVTSISSVKISESQPVSA